MQENYFKVIEQLEKQKYKFRSYYNSCIILLNFQSKIDEDKFKNLEGKKILIYGCGDIGKRFFDIVKYNVNVIGFIDQSAKDNSYEYEGKKVISLNKFNDKIEFDYIVITLSDIYQLIYDKLLLYGIKHEQIKSIEEIL